MELRLPNISGSDREQLAQIRSYLYQIIPQLQWAINNMGTTSSSTQVESPTPKSLIPTNSENSTSALATFNSIKSLIIKSADIVDVYYEKINAQLDGEYVAQSDFGRYVEETTQKIEANSTSTTQRFDNIQTIITGLGGSVASLEGEVGALDTSLQTTKEELTGNINSAKSALEGNIDSTKEELSGSIDDAKTELSGMVSDVDEDLQATKTDVNGRIDNTNGSVAGLGEGLNDANSRLADVNKDLQDTKSVVNESIQGVRDRVTGVNALLEDAKAQLNGSLEDIRAYVTGLEQTIIGVSAYLKSGLLYTTEGGIPVYGLEIGQSVRDEAAGTEVFNKYARFTSEKLSFYDSNGYEVAYISDKKLLIKMAEITVSLQIGKLVDLVMDNGDVVTKWVGG